MTRSDPARKSRWDAEVAVLIVQKIQLVFNKNQHQR